jgi:acetyl esterase
MTTASDSDEGDDLEPGIRGFVREMSARWASHPEFATSPPAEQRRIAEAVRAPLTAGGPSMAAVSEHMVPAGRAGNVRIRCFTPSANSPAALIYLHGGGWTIFSLETHDRVMREYAARAGVTVVGVDYALSPEAKYPVALDQAVAVADFLSADGRRLGIDPGRLAIGGDSAGANLAVAACLRLRDRGTPRRLRAMLLNYGVFDRRLRPEALRYAGSGYMLTDAEMEVFWNNYVRDDRDLDDPLVCPIRADLRGLPPALLAVAECDVLAEQNIRMADRLREAGVPVDLKIYRGATHSFLEAVSMSPLADRALAEGASWLRRAVGDGD